MPSKKTIKINVVKEVRDMAWELTILLYPHREMPMSRVIERAMARTLRIAKQRERDNKLDEFREGFEREA